MIARSWNWTIEISDNIVQFHLHGPESWLKISNAITWSWFSIPKDSFRVPCKLCSASWIWMTWSKSSWVLPYLWLWQTIPAQWLSQGSPFNQLALSFHFGPLVDWYKSTRALTSQGAKTAQQKLKYAMMNNPRRIRVVCIVEGCLEVSNLPGATEC